MSTPHFQFQQFTVWQDRCAMKVGTDGVLLGAWSEVELSQKILDIGTGTGLIALMAAQRAPQALVTALEIDAEAAGQARENVARSPFSGRIEVVQADVREFHGTFDCIVCNPPFFSEDTTSPLAQRALARSTSCLSFEDLTAAARRLLCPGGTFHVIVPQNERNNFVSNCLLNDFLLYRECSVQTTERKAPKRVMLSFELPSDTPRSRQEKQTLVLTAPGGGRSEAYQKLTRDFYLQQAPS